VRKRADDEHRLLPRFRRYVPEIKAGPSNGNGNGHNVIASPGDAEACDKRCIPIIGAGIASEIPNTRPDRAVLRLDKR
jgi:hypothetical protein